MIIFDISFRDILLSDMVVLELKSDIIVLYISTVQFSTINYGPQDGYNLVWLISEISKTRFFLLVCAESIKLNRSSYSSAHLVRAMHHPSQKLVDHVQEWSCGEGSKLDDEQLKTKAVRGHESYELVVHNWIVCFIKSGIIHFPQLKSWKKMYSLSFWVSSTKRLEKWSARCTIGEDEVSAHEPLEKMKVSAIQQEETCLTTIIMEMQLYFIRWSRLNHIRLEG